MKFCIKCKIDKECKEFPQDKSRKDGLHPYCKSCHKNKWEKIRHLPETKMKAKKYSRAHALRQYNLTESSYDMLLNKQKGVCVICSKSNKDKSNLAIDHCHITNKVRGLLCSRCNWALGKFEDNPKLLKKAIDYLCPPK